MDHSCHNPFCLHYGLGTYYCNCRISDAKESPAYAGLCQTKRKYDEFKASEVTYEQKKWDELNNELNQLQRMYDAKI
jgi:hypothetical protein